MGNEFTWADIAPGRFFCGLDLGQSHDHTALVIAERRGEDRQTCHLAIGAMRRYELGLPYDRIVEDVGRRLEHAPKNTALVVDATGVGLPIYQYLTKHPLMRGRYLTGVIITAGDSVSRGDGGIIRVPKRNLVSSLQILLQSGRLKIAANIPEAELLTKEMKNFKVKISLAGHDSYEAALWRENQHDDMVLAASLAAWAALDTAHFGEFKLSPHPRFGW